MAENTKGDGALIQPILAWGCERFFDVLTVYARIFARNFAHRCAVVSSYLGPMYTMFNGVRLLRNLQHAAACDAWIRLIEPGLVPLISAKFTHFPPVFGEKALRKRPFNMKYAVVFALSSAAVHHSQPPPARPLVSLTGLGPAPPARIHRKK